MIASRLLTVAAAAVGFAIAAPAGEPTPDPVREYIDDTSSPWLFTSGAVRVNDSNVSIYNGGYTLLPSDGKAQLPFYGSGVAVWFVIPGGNPAGTIRANLDGGKNTQTIDFGRAIPETLYNQKLYSSHGHAITSHTLYIETTGFNGVGIDYAIFNPGAPSPEDPDDD